MKLPEINDMITTEQALELCKHFKLDYLIERIESKREMTEGDFNFHAVFDNLPEWIQELDIESIKKDAVIETSTEQTP